MCFDRIGQLAEERPGHPSDQWRDPDVEAPVLLRMDAHVVERLGRHRRRRAVEQPPAQVLRLEDLTEALDTPVVDQELQPGPRPQPPEPVVAEDPDDAGPDVRDLFQWDPGTEPLGQLGVGGQPATDPQVEAGAVPGVHDADERDVVDLVHDVRQPADRGLELARQVGELGRADVSALDLLDGPGRVEHLGGRDTGDGRAENHARYVAARLGRRQPDSFEPPPDLGNVLDPDPVQLDVLAVGHVGRVAGIAGRDVGNDAQLLGAELPAVDADPHHEVLVVELVWLEHGRASPRNSWAALGVEAPPAETPAQVGWVDARESTPGVDGLDPAAHVEAVVVLLGALVRVERLQVTQSPLALSAPARAGGCGGWHGCGVLTQIEGTQESDGFRQTADDVGRRFRAPGRRWVEWGAVRPADTSCCAPGRSPRGGGPRGRAGSQTTWDAWWHVGGDRADRASRMRTRVSSSGRHYHHAGAQTPTCCSRR